MLWSAICFKIMPRYTCVFLSRILAFFPALWGFYSQVYDHFLTNAHRYAHKKSPHIYALQTSMCIGVTESRRIRGTELYRQQKGKGKGKGKGFFADGMIRCSLIRRLSVTHIHMLVCNAYI